MLANELPPDWLAGFGGGLLIGLSAALLFWLLGRIAGISGILGGLLTGAGAGDRAWRLCFLAGLLAAGFLIAPAPVLTPGISMPLLVVAGLLVGVGTRMSSGCTSGHGVCGLGRLSPRSLAATLTFMAAGFATVWLLRHGGLLPGGA